MRRVLVVAGIVLIAAIVVTYAFQRTGPGTLAGPAALSGATARSFPAQQLDGAPGSLADYRGHVVLLNLWASWCTPCREEMPDLERLYRENGPHGLVVLGVDQGESRDVAYAFVHQHGVTFPILVDAEERYGRAYAAIGLPTSLVIDPNGQIRHGYDGQLTLAQMQKAVAPLLHAP